MSDRSTTSRSSVEPERLNGGAAVLSPDPTHTWESRVVLNPAAVLVDPGKDLERLFSGLDLDPAQRDTLRDSGGACVMLYRAQGKREWAKRLAPSYLGMAVFTPHLALVKRWKEPVLRPDASFHNLGVEDPRCTKVGGLYYLYYTGYALVPSGGVRRVRRVQICLATTPDFRDWTLHGPVAVSEYPNKNAALLPSPVGEKWILLHRPMKGPEAMTVHWAMADNPAGPWHSRGALMKSYSYPGFRKSWIGAGGPPLLLDDGRFLMIYHQGHRRDDGSREYHLAAALLDFSRRDPVVARIEPIMRPESEAERAGDPELGVDNVLFTCANYVFGDELIIPYAGADSRIFGASVGVSELTAALDAQAR